MTRFPDLFADLAAPFDAREIKTRVQGNQRFSYITARTVMNRLDEVVGPENWWDDYEHNEESVVCRLTVRLPDGTTVTKCDAGGYAGMADSGDDEKSAYSDAFKRAAAKFGVGRHLYGDGIPNFQRASRSARSEEARGTAQAAVAPGASSEPTAAADTLRRERRGPVAARSVQSEDPTARSVPVSVRESPEISGVETVAATAARSQRDDESGTREGFVPPRTGRALFSWAREIDQRSKIDLIRHLSAWGRHHEFPDRIVDWDGEQVRCAYEEAVRKLSELSAAAIPA